MLDEVGRQHLPARAATAIVADLEQLAERYHALYETADPAALLVALRTVTAWTTT